MRPWGSFYCSTCQGRRDTLACDLSPKTSACPAQSSCAAPCQVFGESGAPCATGGRVQAGEPMRGAGNPAAALEGFTSVSKQKNVLGTALPSLSLTPPVHTKQGQVPVQAGSHCLLTRLLPPAPPGWAGRYLEGAENCLARGRRSAGWQGALPSPPQLCCIMEGWENGSSSAHCRAVAFPQGERPWGAGLGAA